MNEVVHIIPSAPTFKDWAIRVWEAITNQEELIVFPKTVIRQLYKQAYPKAKV